MGHEPLARVPRDQQRPFGLRGPVVAIHDDGALVEFVHRLGMRTEDVVVDDRCAPATRHLLEQLVHVFGEHPADADFFGARGALIAQAELMRIEPAEVDHPRPVRLDDLLAHRGHQVDRFRLARADLLDASARAGRFAKRCILSLAQDESQPAQRRDERDDFQPEVRTRADDPLNFVRREHPRHFRFELTVGEPVAVIHHHAVELETRRGLQNRQHLFDVHLAHDAQVELNAAHLQRRIIVDHAGG